ncbi:ABC transporter ATP-binding protein [Paeniglutamicibacter sp. MACA_103]|uniref:ABC transporter ATP-binding protein n=1 Tax=Paeniglutamicibacter sp. MACA_103 TaxID=3377337 RepID=UPI003894BFAC
MLIADNLAIAGRHLPLLEPTSLTAARGELLLVEAEPQPTRTALALGLSARMRPGEGTVSWSGTSALRSVRRISALVDSPEINEPEAHLKVRDLVAEDLALQPGPVWRRSGIEGWMRKHGMEALANQWLDAIDPLERLTLLTHLALEDRSIELLVFDSPDRHGIPAEDWTRYLQSVATSRRAPAVVAVIQRIPEGWNGSVARAGQVQDKLAAAVAPPPAAETEPTAAPVVVSAKEPDQALPAAGETPEPDAPAADVVSAAPTTLSTAPKEES